VILWYKLIAKSRAFHTIYSIICLFIVWLLDVFTLFWVHFSIQFNSIQNLLNFLIKYKLLDNYKSIDFVIHTYFGLNLKMNTFLIKFIYITIYMKRIYKWIETKIFNKRHNIWWNPNKSYIKENIKNY